MDNSDNRGEPRLSFSATPERSLIRPSSSFRHIDFAIGVADMPAPDRAERLPLKLALVLDRSGSMDGEKLATAKQVVSAVLDQLDDRDQVAAVCFDDRIEVLQESAPATAAAKARIRRVVDDVQTRGSTNLHEGWLTGCQAIAPEGRPPTNAVARCFLLTDGLANQGLTDPEQIATQTAGVHDNAGIITSTFGIGPDYDEHLLGPMAVAGAGAFHNLRTVQDIPSTFLGELNAALAVAVRDVRLEIQHEGVPADVVSQFWAESKPGGTTMVVVGDLIGGEERHIVVRFGFPPTRIDPPGLTTGDGLIGLIAQGAAGEFLPCGPSDEPNWNPDAGHFVRYRVAWRDADGERQSTAWLETAFLYAQHTACDMEQMNPAAMHWVGLAHADRARRAATAMDRAGDNRGARRMLNKVAKRTETYAGSDRDLRSAIAELRKLERDLKLRPQDTLLLKETLYLAQTRSRGQKDYR